MLFGVGRYLYNIQSPWVKLDGKNIDKSEYPKLKKLLYPFPTAVARNAEYARVEQGINDAVDIQQLIVFWKENEEIIFNLFLSDCQLEADLKKLFLDKKAKLSDVGLSLSDLSRIASGEY